MRVMDELTESTHRRTPSFPHAGGQSPRVGGCVGALYHLFDWNLSKRVSSTKRITADRPNREAFYGRSDRSFTERASPLTSKLPPINKVKEDAISPLKKTPTYHSTPSPASVKSDDANKRVPGVVARLMGLESLPGRTYISSPKSGIAQELHSNVTAPPPREQLGPPPVLLQELLRQEFQHSKKSLKDKLPGFTNLGRGAAPQRKSPKAPFEEHVHPYGNSRAPGPLVHSTEKKAASCTQEESKTLTKNPFLARLQIDAPCSLQTSSSQTSTSPLLSPSMLGGKNTARLLEAAVKALEPSMQPSPRTRYPLTIRESHRETRSEGGVSLRSEKRALTGSRAGSPANSSSRSVRSQSSSRTWSGKDDRAVRSGHESNSPGRKSSRARPESSRQIPASRTRFEKTLVNSSRSVSPLQTHRSRASNTKRVEDSPRAFSRTHEASIRGFKTDLSNQIDSPSDQKKLENAQDFHPQYVEFEVHPEKLPPTPSPNYEGTHVKVDSPEPCNCDQNADVLKADISQNSPGMSKTLPEKSVSSGGFRSIRFRSRSGKQEKDVGGQGNRVFPSDKHPVEKPVGSPPPKEANVAYAGFSYSIRFSRKQGDKKERNDKGEAPVMKWTDSTLMRSLLRRPSKSSKRVNVEVEKMEPTEGVANQDSSSQEPAASRETSHTHRQLEKTKEESHIVQARYRSIDEVFPEIPIEEKDVSGASPDLGKTIQAVEEKFLGFGSQGDADCRSIERMFGKGFSRTYPDLSSLENPAPETSPISQEAFITECGVPGTFPNSPSAKYEKNLFSSRNQLNLQEMFEVVSGDRSHDLTSRRRSFCLSEPSERVLDDEEAGAESDTCSNSAAVTCDTGSTPERLEIHTNPVAVGWSKDAMTPPALKKFEEKLAQGFSDSDDSHALCADECGQPSPVSVLQSPFLDEVPTTPDASLAELQQTDEHLNDIGDMEPPTIQDDEERTQETKENMATLDISEAAMPETIETEMIEQAILDISRIRNIDVRAIGLEPPTVAPVEPQQEQNYIREVLDAANLLRKGGSGWHSGDSPMNRSLFDRLESGSGSLRSERKLLFDSVNEVMALEPWMRTSSFYVDLPMFSDLHLKSKFRLPISGEALVTEVYRMICHWKDIAGNVLDDLIDYDMNVPEGRWVNFSHEVADVGLEIERSLLKGMIKEVVDDMTSIFAKRALTTS